MHVLISIESDNFSSGTILLSIIFLSLGLSNCAEELKPRDEEYRPREERCKYLYHNILPQNWEVPEISLVENNCFLTIFFILVSIFQIIKFEVRVM